MQPGQEPVYYHDYLRLGQLLEPRFERLSPN